MANRRGGTDDFSSSSVDETGKTNFIVSGTNLPRDNNHRARDEMDHSSGTNDSSRETRREENPFSFKHFLKKDTRPNYNLAGARPKVYSPARISPHEDTVAEDDGIYPCNPTELPDFVQDHLVIEQCYLNHDAAASVSSSLPLVADIDNLPDFTINNAERRQSTRGHRNETENSEITRDLPFDLTGGLERRNRERNNSAITNSGTNDPPSYPRPNQLPIRRDEPPRNQQTFPFDLPASIAVSSATNSVGTTNSSVNDTSVNKSLPDFLNDGPIRNRVDVSTGESDNSLDMPERSDASLLLENERLREELKIARRHIVERMRTIESLEADLASRRAVDHDETTHLEKAMEQVEVNLKRSTRRATVAESAVTLLKQEVKALTAEVTTLRSENRELRSIAGAGCADYHPSGTERRIKKLSEELRAAATTAESSLRQLMSGVNNLKIMASTLENVDRIEDRTKDFLPDFEEENAAGPAL